MDGQLTQASPFPERRNQVAMAFDRGRNRMVAFGGISRRTFPIGELNVDFAETWERDGTGTWQVITDQSPPRRVQAAMAYDEARGVTVLYGGATCDFHPERCPWGDPAGRPFYDETWEWDGATWTPRGTLPDPMHGYPPRLLLATFAYDRTRNVYVLYRYYDTWELDGAGQWHRRAVHGSLSFSGETPSLFGLAMQDSMASDSDLGRTLLYSIVPTSLTTGEGRLSEWTGSTWQRKITVPLPLTDGALEYDSGRRRMVMISGGSGFGSAPTDEVFEWRYFADDPTCRLGPP